MMKSPSRSAPRCKHDVCPSLKYLSCMARCCSPHHVLLVLICNTLICINICRLSQNFLREHDKLNSSVLNIAYHHHIKNMLTRCRCDKCDGRLVSWHVKSNHERAQLKSHTTAQNISTGQTPPVASSGHIPASSATPAPPIHDTASPAPIPSESPDHAYVQNSQDLQMIQHDPISGAGLALDAQTPHFADHVTVDLDLIQYGQYDQEGPVDEESFPGVDIPDHEENFTINCTFPSMPSEDDPNPFLVDHTVHNTSNIQHIPHHLLVIYVVVSWLHLRFALPRIACNALLVILAHLLTFVDPTLTTPFITLQSATRTLGLDPTIQILPICPNCREVYPSAGSKHVQETCTACKVPLFRSDQTKRGNQRVNKIPLVKYPYLPLSDQITSVLKVPGVEAILDEWRTKPRALGVYTDIFDGNVCRLGLKAPDGKLFFSNLPHEINGPHGELRIGVCLGVDWCVVYDITIHTMY